MNSRSLVNAKVHGRCKGILLFLPHYRKVHVNLCAMQVAAHQGQEGSDNSMLFAVSLKVRAQHKANFSQALKRLSLRRFLFPQMKATAAVRSSSCKASGGQARLRRLHSLRYYSWVNKRKSRFTDLPAPSAGGQQVHVTLLNKPSWMWPMISSLSHCKPAVLKQVFCLQDSARHEAWWPTHNLGRLKPSGYFDFNATEGDVSIIPIAA